MADNLLTMTQVEEFLANVRRQADAALDCLVPAADVEPARLHEAVRWSVFAGGKRIRPALVFAAGRSFGAPDSELVTTAASIEMIHTYSLIHDDLPAMDDDDLRRGRPTCHTQFGEATAILAGDVLQTLAFKSIAEDKALSPDTRIKVISAVATAAGTPAGMVSGQQLDLEAEGRMLTIDEIEQIHGKKTGALITAAACSGAIVGGASDTEMESIRRYSGKLGLLFQITDDLLDVTQSTERLGKTAGKDASARKATFPALVGVDETHRLAARVYDEALLALSGIDKDTELLRYLAEIILKRTS